MTLHRLLIAATLLAGVLRAGPAATAEVPAPVPSAAEARIEIAQAPPAPDTATPAATDAAAAPASPDPIGNVAALTGTVTVIRNKDSLPVRLRDDIFLNDIVQTSAGASLGITFDDGTTFRLSANARITIDNYIYEDGGKQNSAVFNIGSGTVAFVAAAVAKTGDMKIDTPTATLGIRGTTGLVEVPDDGSPARPGHVAIKLYPDADGRVGHIEVNDRTGARLGALTQGASGFTIRPGAGGGAMRFAAVPLVIAAREVQRDRSFVREVHVAQTMGRQIVTEQRAFRRANPGLAPNRGNPQRPNGMPGQQNQRGQQQPATPGAREGRQQRPQPGANPRATQPNRDRQGHRQGGRRSEQPNGLQQRPGSAQPSPLPARPGLQQGGLQQGGALPQRNQQTNQARPAAPTLPVSPEARPGGLQQAAPQLQRPAMATRPALQRGRPVAAPKGRRRDQPPR